jgi:polysaccharide export outer membrane protein
MRAVKRLLVALFLLALIPFPLRAAEKEAALPGPEAEAALQATAEPDYRIGPGDQLNIEVWKDKDLARLVTVLPDGKVAYPMVGEVVAVGKTVAQLQKEIERKLSLYVKDAVITVEVRKVNSLQIYVLGRVKTPGRSLLTSNTDVLQALAIAGGPTSSPNCPGSRSFAGKGGRPSSSRSTTKTLSRERTSNRTSSSGGGTW